MVIVNFGELEKYIKEIEAIFDRDELNIIEKKLVLQEAFKRIQKKIHENDSKDLLGKMPLKDMVSRMMKGE